MRRAPDAPRLLAAALAFVITSAAQAAPPHAGTLQGSVAALNGIGQANYKVSMYASFGDRGPSWRLLGTDTSTATGDFRISYALPPGLADKEPALFLFAEKGAAMLASAIGTASTAPADVVVNERTTVATGNAFAQFVAGRAIDGNATGVRNAVRMAANLADPRTGAAGVILASTPNGTDTSTFATFNALANVVASCVADARNCARLFQAATPPGGPPPANVLQAIANIVKHPAYPGYPSNADDPLFQLSQATPVYQPSLIAATDQLAAVPQVHRRVLQRPGQQQSDERPGQLRDRRSRLCMGERQLRSGAARNVRVRRPALAEVLPLGRELSRLAVLRRRLERRRLRHHARSRRHRLDRQFRIPGSAVRRSSRSGPPRQRVGLPSERHADLSAAGYRQGDISWPQGTVSDRKGNIWVANCGNDSVTLIPRGDPARAFNIPLGPIPPDRAIPQMKPFGAAVDLDGNVVDRRHRSNSFRSSPRRRVDRHAAGHVPGKDGAHPSDRQRRRQQGQHVGRKLRLGRFALPDALRVRPAANPSITLFDMKTRTPHPGSPFTGGGLKLPWGIAVDGDDTVWVFNFGAVPVLHPTDTPTAVSRFCGTDTAKCPPGLSPSATRSRPRPAIKAMRSNASLAARSIRPATSG